jgi:hypothetical protein
MNPDLSSQLTKAFDDLDVRATAHASMLEKLYQAEFHQPDDDHEDKWILPTSKLSLSVAEFNFNLARSQAIRTDKNSANQSQRDANVVLACQREQQVLDRSRRTVEAYRYSVANAALNVQVAQAHLRMLEAQVALITQK